jgi:UDP-3-O-[3-hydroxymyristoyl] N-acetylglucosamine deacetylase
VVENQKTLKSKISFSGVGLHSGVVCKIDLIPEVENTGIYFIFKNLKKKIKCLWTNAHVSQLCTTIKSNKISISTTEHLMSALSGLGITNLRINISGNEIPILDGSSKDFVKKILETGIVEQSKKSKVIIIKKKIKFYKDNKSISIEPNLVNDSLIIDCEINFNDELIKKQRMVYEHSFENYLQIYDARTFCLQEDLDRIFAMGLGKGGSLDNAIIVSGKKVLNQGGLRYPNEFVRHKILDCVGDIYLSGYKIVGKIKSYQSGHEMNFLLLKELFKNKNAFIIK